MFLIPLFARMIYAHMPLGSSYKNPMLKKGEAYDLAAYINSGINVGSKIGLSHKHSKSRASKYPMKAFRNPAYIIWEDYTKGKEDPEYIKARFGPFKEEGEH